MFPKILISDPLICTRTCAYLRVRNVSFLGNFTCLLMEDMKNEGKTKVLYFA